MKSRLATFTVVVAAAVFLLGGVCGRKLYPPEFISAPSSVYAGDPAVVKLIASGRGYESVRYIVNWGDATVDTSEPYSLNDVATMWHVWTETGSRQVRAAVYSPDDPQGIRWAAQRSVDVEAGGDHAPVIDTVLLNQGVAVRGAASLFTVKAHDPDGDSLRLKFGWGATETTTAYLASPCSISVSHVFTEVGTALVSVYAQDTRGATSNAETLFVPVGLAGGVKWYWQSLGMDGLYTSPLCLSDGQEECIYAPSDWDMSFRSIRVGNGKSKRSAQTQWPSFFFSSYAAFCEATQHIIVGSDEGELYALIPDLSRAWLWPNRPQDSLTLLEWGPPAITGDRIYVPREDESLYYFIDSIDHGVRVATFAAGAGIVDAPVIDAQGNVYFGTDSGYVFKVGPELDTMLWRARLIADGEIRSLIIGGDGRVYCSSESSRIYAIDPMTGAMLWALTTEGRPSKLAAGSTAVFFGTDLGVVYAVNPTMGTLNWQKSLAQGTRFLTAPIAAANGYVYLLDGDGVLYNLNQLDGTLIWACDCNYYLPGGGKSSRPKKTGFPHDDPDPTITSTGDVIVPGQSAVFCVAGYPEGPLDPLAPWPKWQHDLYNTGYVGGGR